MRLRLVLPALALLSGCGDDTADPSGGDTDGAAHEGPGPYEDAWVLEVDQPFDAAAVQSLRIGGQESSDNFANRGDVVVRYADTDRIQVEVRRFTFAANLEDAQEDFDRLSLWAYASAGSPSPPSAMDPAEGCADPLGEGAWPDGCQLRIYYDGLVQLSRSGADIRVTLPRAFEGALEVATEDNDADSDYHDRARVCIEDLPGSADVELGAGEAFVILAPDVTPFPLCGPEDVAACETAGWTQGCTCLAVQGQASSLAVRSGDGQAADATVDVPEELWARYSLVIMGMSAEDGCTASVDPGAAAHQPNEDQDALGSALGLLNQPPPPAQTGVGYGITLSSDDCAFVTATSTPDDFVGQGNGPQQHSAERGDLAVCAGCLREQGCAGLLGE